MKSGELLLLSCSCREPAVCSLCHCRGRELTDRTRRESQDYVSVRMCLPRNRIKQIQKNITQHIVMMGIFYRTTFYQFDHFD